MLRVKGQVSSVVAALQQPRLFERAATGFSSSYRPGLETAGSSESFEKKSHCVFSCCSEGEVGAGWQGVVFTPGVNGFRWR